MNKKLSLLLIVSLSSLFISGCKKEVKTYTVQFVDYNGNILDTVENVKEGSLVNYSKTNPTRDYNDGKLYSFIGWYPSINNAIKENTVYTAQYKETFIGNINGVNLEVDQQNNCVYYGFYPQSVVTDSNIIDQLKLINASVNGWYLLDGQLYAKKVTKLFNGETYTYRDGVSQVTNEKEEFFKCEKIKWKILNNENNNYYLISESLLDACQFNDYQENVVVNNYNDSTIKNFIENTFFNTAFSLNKGSFSQTNKISLPTKADLTNATYGFENTLVVSESREAKVSDYCLAGGGWYNNRDSKYKFNSSYWTKDPSTAYNYASTVVNSAGAFQEYSVDRDNHCIRPVINVTL